MPNALDEQVLLGSLDPHAQQPFGPDSVLRRVVAEPVTTLVVQRALVMEVAHPKVAAGVDDHSGFRAHPISRAWVTADAALRLVFGDAEIARGAARQIYRTHDRINGRLSENAGEWSAGASYTAHDASLLTWVWATLVDSAQVAYTRWVRSFSDEEADVFYAEALAFARFLGIARDLLPADRGAFAEYTEDMLAGPVLASTETSRRLAAQVLWYRHWSVPPPLVQVQRAIALATLDERLVERLGLARALDSVDARLGGFVDRELRRWYRHLPRTRIALPGIYLMLRRPTLLLGELRRGELRREVQTGES